LKKRFGSNLNNIQILNPVVSARARERDWNWLLIPRHDRLEGPNIINFSGSLVKTPPPLAAEKPRLLLLLGGATAYLPWDESSLNTWLDRAVERGLPVTICPSRRTPAAILQRLKTWLALNPGGRYIDTGNSGLYRQAMGEAAEFWVSGDSINMLAEACASDRSVRVLGAGLVRGKVKRYINELDNLGRFESSVPIREAGRVAAELIKRGVLLGFA
jgi:mitochondrial fission protein ELM1